MRTKGRPPKLLTEDQLVSIYRSEIRPLYCYVSKRVGGERQLAEDFVQETFLRAVSEWRRSGPPKEPLAWLKRVARNLLVSHWRRTRPDSLERMEVDPVDDAWRPANWEEAAFLQRGLSLLPKRQAELIEAFHFEGKTTREISRELGLSERAVEGRLRRAREALRDKLGAFPKRKEIRHEEPTRT